MATLHTFFNKFMTFSQLAEDEEKPEKPNSAPIGGPRKRKTEARDGSMWSSRPCSSPRHVSCHWPVRQDKRSTPDIDDIKPYTGEPAIVMGLETKFMRSLKPSGPAPRDNLYVSEFTFQLFYTLSSY